MSAPYTAGQFVDAITSAIQSQDAGSAVELLCMMAPHYPVEAEQVRLSMLAGIAVGKARESMEADDA